MACSFHGKVIHSLVSSRFIATWKQETENRVAKRLCPIMLHRDNLLNYMSMLCPPKRCKSKLPVIFDLLGFFHFHLFIIITASNSKQS